jgi:hypothetical protein
MDSGLYDDLALEEGVKEYFKLSLAIKDILLRDIPVSHTMTATVFLSDKNQLYVYIDGKSRTKLADIKKIVARMGVKPLTYIPPRGDKDYFMRIAKVHFNNTFPGRRHISDHDLDYYKTLCSYSPALVQVEEVIKGMINQYDTDSPTQWRPALRYSYRRIMTI